MALFMKIGVADIVEFFQPHNIEEIVPVGNLPRIEHGGKPLMVLPEIKRRVIPGVIPDVGMAGNRNALLLPDAGDNLLDCQVRRNI